MARQRAAALRRFQRLCRSECRQMRMREVRGPRLRNAHEARPRDRAQPAPPRSQSDAGAHGGRRMSQDPVPTREQKEQMIKIAESEARRGGCTCSPRFELHEGTPGVVYV